MALYVTSRLGRKSCAGGPCSALPSLPPLLQPPCTGLFEGPSSCRVKLARLGARCVRYWYGFMQEKGQVNAKQANNRENSVYQRVGWDNYTMHCRLSSLVVAIQV